MKIKNLISPQVCVAFAASVGTFIYGLVLGWSSQAGPKLLSTDKFEVSSNIFSWSVSMLPLGAASTVVLAGISRDYFGTKLNVLIFTLPNIAGWLFLIFAYSSWMLLVGRYLIGFGSGGYCFTVPMYIGEIASKKTRGILLTFFEVSVKTGILLAYVIGAVTSLLATNIICCSLVICYAMLFMLLPETPIYLIEKGRKEEAKYSLRLLRGANYDINEYFELQKQSDEQKTMNVRFYEELKNRASRKAFIIIICVFILFQLCGINAIVFYSTQIFTEAEVSIEPYIATVVLGVIQVFGVLIAIPFIDRYGRKFLLIPSFIAMSTGMFCIGAYFQLKDVIDLTAFKILPLILLCIFLVGFSLGIGTIAFVLIGELFSMNAKKVIAPLAQTTNYILGFSIALLFPRMVATIGSHYTFYIFGSVSIFGLLFTIFAIPETKGKSLLEIQKILLK